MLHLRRWEFMGELVGIGLTRVVMTFAVIWLLSIRIVDH